MIKVEKYRVLCGILFSVMLLIILAACENLNSSKNEGDNVISKDKNEISLKIENTKTIGISNPVSSDSNDSVNITDPEIINEIENLFSKTSFIKCTAQEPIRADSLFVSFRNDDDSRSICLFVYTNGIMNIDGIKYKSEDITFDAINTYFLNWQQQHPKLNTFK